MVLAKVMACRRIYIVCKKLLRLSASFLSVVVIMYVHLLCWVVFPKIPPPVAPPVMLHLLDSHLRQVLAARLCKLLKVHGEV